MEYGDWDRRELADIDATLRAILAVLERIYQVLTLPQGFTISQKGYPMITGIQVGGSGTFQESYIPVNAALPAGASLSLVWTADDPLVTLAPDAAGDSVVATVPAGDTQGSAPAGQQGSFNLTVTGTFSGISPLPAPITGTANVPIMPAPAPLPTGLEINQTA
jgi:hypothetical protein